MGVYNATDRTELKKSIESIIDQSYTDWECIICDDASNDGTYEFLIENWGSDKRFVIIKNNENSGLGFSLNRCLSIAKGIYIIRQDADDYSKFNRFEVLVSYMEANRDVDVLGSGMYLFDSNGIWGSYYIRTYEIKREDFLIGTVVAHPSVIMKTSSLKSNGGYRVSWETRRCEDYDLFMRMYKNGSKIVNLSEKLYYYKEERYGKKRKLVNVIKESVVRFKGFYNLKLFPIGFLYVFKPYLVFLLPKSLIKRLRKGQ